MSSVPEPQEKMGALSTKCSSDVLSQATHTPFAKLKTQLGSEAKFSKCLLELQSLQPDLEDARTLITCILRVKAAKDGVGPSPNKACA